MSTLQKWIVGLLVLAFASMLALLVIILLVVTRPTTLEFHPPSVVISSPAAGATVVVGRPVKVLIDARDAADVTRLELQVDGKSIGANSSLGATGQPSLSAGVEWTPETAGPHVLVAWAYDLQRAASSSAPIAILAAPAEVATAVVTPTREASVVTPTVLPPEPTATATPLPAPSQIAALWDRLTRDWADAHWAAAIADLEQVAAIDPSYDDIRTKLYAAHVNFGNAWLAQGNSASALTEFQAALALKPDGTEALAALQRLQPPPPTTATPTPTPNPVVPRPVVQILAPAPGARVGVGQAIDISVVAASRLNIARAELWVDGGSTPVATLNNPAPNVQTWQFSFRWSSYVLGNHALIVRAYDAKYVSGDSPYVSVTVAPNAQPPRVWMTNPADGQRFQVGQAVQIDGVATDDVGVVRVETWVDGAVWRVDSSAGQSPLAVSHRWSADQPGKHTLKLRAVDTANAVAESPTLTVQVEDVTVPVVRIESPSGGSMVNKNQRVDVRSAAVDRTGVARVELYVDGRLARTDGNPNPGQSTWTVTQAWTANEAGEHILTTRAYDPGGRSGVSQQVVVDVRGAPAPTPTPDLNGYWYGPVQGSNMGFFLLLAQHGPTLDGTCWFDDSVTRMDGALSDSVVSGERVNLHADFMLEGVGVDLAMTIRNGGQNLAGTFRLTTGPQGSVTFRRSGPPPPHPAPRPTTPPPTPTEEPRPGPVYPTQEPMPGPVYPTQEPMPDPVYPTQEPMPGPLLDGAPNP